MAAEHGHDAFEVTVTFPLAHGQPFHEREPAVATAGQVLDQALAKFGIQPEPSSTYFLTFDGARIDAAQPLSAIASHGDSLKFTLVKELIQGS